MADVSSTWVIGSYDDLPDQAVTIFGSPETVTATNGGIYLYSATSANSLVTQFQTQMTNAGLTTAVCRLQKDGKVFLSAVESFAVTFTDTLLRDLLGFTGNLTAATSHTAPNQSPLLWRASRVASPLDAPLDYDGARVYDQATVISPDARQVTTSFGTNRVNRLHWSYLVAAKYKTTSDANSEFAANWDYWMRKGWHFFYATYTEDEASTAAVTHPSLLGPYAVDLSKMSTKEPHTRSAGFEMHQDYYDLELPIVKVSEYVA